MSVLLFLLVFHEKCGPPSPCVPGAGDNNAPTEPSLSAGGSDPCHKTEPGSICHYTGRHIRHPIPTKGKCLH